MMKQTALVVLLLSVFLASREVAGISVAANDNMLVMPAACTMLKNCWSDISLGVTTSTNCPFPSCPEGYYLSNYFPASGLQTTACLRGTPYELTSAITFQGPTSTAPFTSLNGCLTGLGPSKANYCIGRLLEANRICIELAAYRISPFPTP